VIKRAGRGEVVWWWGVDEKAAGECERKREGEWWGSRAQVAVVSSMMT